MPLDGSTQNQQFDTSQLPSGTYQIWAEADDQNSGLVRVYAPNPVAIQHAWPSSWEAKVTITHGYRELLVEWEAPSPDADSYVVTMGTSPESYSHSVEKQHVRAATLAALEPGVDHFLRILAIDSKTGKSVQSQPMPVRTMTAEFDLTAPATELAMYPNERVQGTFTLNTNLAPIQTRSGLTVVSIPAGFSLSFDQPVFVPTTEQSTIPFTLRSGEAVTTGEYEMIVMATGGGVSRQIPLKVRVSRPSFMLQSDRNTVELQRDGRAEVTINTNPSEGSTRPINFQVTGAPVGIEWRFSQNSVTPGQATVLTLADTSDLAGGSYSILVVGDDGTNQVRLELIIFVSKPSFEFTIDVKS